MTLPSSNCLQISGTVISDASPPYLIAEIGTNHNRDYNTALRLIDLASEAGFNAVKFQIYEPSEIVSPTVLCSDYSLHDLYGHISAQEMFSKYLMTPKDWFPELIKYCHNRKLHVGATVHGSDGLHWFKSQQFDFLKVASMDNTNLALLREIKTESPRPVLVSLGMAHLHDVKSLVEALNGFPYGYGLFHCTTIYPPTPTEERLGNIVFLKNCISDNIGFSDHSLGCNSAVTAFYLGARFFEKHITLDPNQAGPDHSFAADYQVACDYVHQLHQCHQNLNCSSFLPLSSRESSLRSKYHKSCFLKHDLPEGHILRDTDLLYSRPGSGMPSSAYESLLGRRLSTNLPAWTMLASNHVI